MASNFMKLKRRRFYNLVCYVHNWNDGMLGYWDTGSVLHRIEKYHDSWGNSENPSQKL
jgi:hypothetical protein